MSGRSKRDRSPDRSSSPPRSSPSPRRSSRRSGVASSSPVPHASSSPMPTSSPARNNRPRRRQKVDDDELGEDLMDENMANDYREIAELDRYEGEGIATSSPVSDMAARDRKQAEREMRRRDIEEARREQRVPQALLSDEEEDDEEEEKDVRRRRFADETAPMVEDEDAEEVYLSLEDYQGSLTSWLQRDRVRREVKRRFKTFLSDFVDTDGNSVYPRRISTMCAQNKSSLLVNYVHLSLSFPVAAIWVADAPKQMIEILDEASTEVTMNMFPDYRAVSNDIHTRITDLPIVDSIRDLRQSHLNALIKVVGVVTRRTSVFPQLKVVRFNCIRCGFLSPPYTQSSDVEIKPTRCMECQETGPFSVNNEQTVYRNFQKLTLQESPGSVPAGRVPRQKDIILLHDLIDVARPGEEIEVTGVYANNFDVSMNAETGFPVFRTMIEANYVSSNKERLSTVNLTDEDTREIHKLSKRPDVAQLIFNSIAPSIYGHPNIKIALALSMFAGVAKHLPNKHRLRGDINVLLLGDPGMGKSQFLKYVEKTAHRCVYTTGKGASAVGLTASVRLDPMTREWTLEGGAMVLADQGTCLIDEFDKMNDQDRTSIHEAMEQQSISISKAGIITTLQARCGIIAAANPTSGRYNSALSFAENVELTDAILSRFDILCVIRDTVDPVADERLADFVVSSHMNSHPSMALEAENLPDPVESIENLDTIPQDLLRKYIYYARNNCSPTLHGIDQDKIAKLYSELRRESMVSGGIPIAVRHIESMVRMAEAHAKIHLRDHVNDEDVDMAIRVMLESFISTQKFSVMRSLQKQFHRYVTYKKDTFDLLLFILKAMVRENMARMSKKEGERIVVLVDEFQERAKEYEIRNVASFYKSSKFTSNHFSLDKKKEKIIFTP